MFTNTLSYVMLVSFCLRTLWASPFPVLDLSTPPEDDLIRRDKAYEILKYMNEFADPCEDFYEFTCGNYATYNPATPQLPGTGMFQTLQLELESKIKTILSSEDDVGDTLIDKQVKSFYKSCLNLPTLQHVYADKLREIIGEFGQMPALVGETWREDDFDWMQTVADIAFKYGIKILLEFDVAIDFANNSVNRLYVSEQDFGVSKSLYQEGDKSEELVALKISTNAAHLGLFLGLPVEVAVQTAVENMKLEKSLVKATFDQQSGLQLKELYKALDSLDEVQQKYLPVLDLKHLLRTTLGSIPKLKVYLDHVYVENLVEVLKVTPKRTVANFIFAKLIKHFIVDLPLAGTKLNEMCIAHLKANFYKHLDNMVYRNYNSKDTEQGVLHMWKDIKSTFLAELQSHKLQWIAEDTRKYAVEKLKAMSLDIISYEDNNFVQELGHLNLDDIDYVENLKAVLSSRAALLRAINHTEPQNFESGPQLSTSPGYIIVENSVKVPVALLQPYYAWSASLPNAFNFGVLGALLSHELVHGYDGGGRSYDAQGNNREWWDEKSAHDFNTRTKCFIDQYKEYIFGGRHLPEMSNQNENIADNGGVRLAYKTYMKWHDEKAGPSGEPLVGESLQGRTHKYNPKQLFFISYGHLWCSDIFADYQTAILSSDEHVPTKFRVIGPLSNFEEFAKEFNCPLGSGMNPVKKCEIY